MFISGINWAGEDPGILECLFIKPFLERLPTKAVRFRMARISEQL